MNGIYRLKRFENKKSPRYVNQPLEKQAPIFAQPDKQEYQNTNRKQGQ